MKTMFRRFSQADDKRVRIFQTIARIICIGFGVIAIISLAFLVAYIGGYFPWILVGAIPLILVLAYFSLRFDMFGVILFWVLSGGWGMFLLYRIIQGIHQFSFQSFLFLFLGLFTGTCFFISWFIENRGVNWEDVRWESKRRNRGNSWSFKHKKK